MAVDKIQLKNPESFTTDLHKPGCAGSSTPLSASAAFDILSILYDWNCRFPKLPRDQFLWILILPQHYYFCPFSWYLSSRSPCILCSASALLTSHFPINTSTWLQLPIFISNRNSSLKSSKSVSHFLLNTPTWGSAGTSNSASSKLTFSSEELKTHNSTHLDHSLFPARLKENPSSTPVFQNTLKEIHSYPQATLPFFFLLPHILFLLPFDFFHTPYSQSVAFTKSFPNETLSPSSAQ